MIVTHVIVRLIAAKAMKFYLTIVSLDFCSLSLPYTFL